MSNRKKRAQDGFALIEVMIAIAILAVGLLGLAALMAQLTGSTTQSRYLGTEVMLASEKLEDLNQLSTNDDALTAGGDLASDKKVTTPGGVFDYYDVVQISSTNGRLTDQTVAGTVNGAPPAATDDMLVFKRRWVIESDTPSPRVRRITVLVIPQTGTTVEKGATFQTTMVRPCDPVNGC